MWKYYTRSMKGGVKYNFPSRLILIENFYWGVAWLEFFNRRQYNVPLALKRKWFLIICLRIHYKNGIPIRRHIYNLIDKINILRLIDAPQVSIHDVPNIFVILNNNKMKKQIFHIGIMKQSIDYVVEIYEY